MKAIETVFDGYRFRSRLDARWAVFFKTLGIKYDYEPDGFDLDGVWYLPDFWIPSWQSWVEIKPEYPSQEEKMKGYKLWEATKNRCLLIWGSPYAYIPFRSPLEATVYYRLQPADEHFLYKHTEQWESTPDGVQVFTECHSCGKLNYSSFSPDERCHGGFGLDCHCTGAFFEYSFELATSDRLIAAYTAARQARFEFGG